MTIRIAIADDHPVILAGLTRALSREPLIDVIGSAEDSSALLELLGTTPVDVLVTDYSMPGGAYGDGASLIGLIGRRFPRLPIVVLTGIENPHVLANIGRAGVTCIVAKADPIDDMVRAINAATQQGSYLSPSIQAQLRLAKATDHASLTRRESEVLRLFAEGLSLMEIAGRLQRSRQTINSQKRSGMTKLGLNGNADLYQYAVTHGWVSASQATRSATRD
ncbi:response regulator [Stenotrophomonas maltophilia]|uniref:response regulator n=1 Tax=Stenotrophomonas maltophilia TaxID=40324 RepID=UPI0034DB3345